MSTIFVEGLGEIEIQGDTPTSEERTAILNALGQSTDTEETVDTTNITPDLGDVDDDKEEINITPEMIDPNLADLGKPEGLEKIGGRPTFEAIGGIFGAVPGTAVGGLPGSVVGGTLGATGGGQAYDILQSFITDESTDFGTQAERLKTDFQREALLQSFFAKVPGLFTATKRFVFGKPEKELYDSAKRLKFPLSLSDSGNIISKGYGRVIGVFPYVGNPIKQAASDKASFLNKKAIETLNTFGPNVTLTKLGIDMAEASKATYGDFRRVSNFFYEDFYKAVDKIGNTPVIPTKNFKASLKNFVDIVDGGKVAGLDSPRKGGLLYNYAKGGPKSPKYINATQYKSLIEDIKTYTDIAAKRGSDSDVRVLTGIKSALETDLRLLTKKSYQDELLTKVYPMSKKSRKKLDPKILSNIAEKLKFADNVYANGVENSIISNSLKNKLSSQTIKQGQVPGKKAFDQPVASTFKRVDRNIFGTGFERPGSITADQLGEALLRRGASPQLFKDLRTLVGEKQFKKFARSKIQSAYDSSLITAGENKVGLVFDPYKFEKNLGLTTEKGRELLSVMLEGSKLNVKNLEDFFVVAKNHAGLKVPDVSSFVARRAVLGGTRSLVGGVIGTVGVTTNPVIGSALIFMARKTSRFLTNPKQLEDVTTLFDPTSSASQMKTASLKLIDAMISDSTTKQEENEFKLMRENIELMSLEQIKKDLEDTIESSQEFLNINNVPEEEQEQEVEDITGDTSQIITPPLETPNINPNLMSRVTGPMNQGLTPTEQALLSPEEQAIRLRSRGLA